MTATGTVEPVTEVEVGTQVSGIIDKLYADYNDVVKAGQLIAEMDKVTLQAELESSQAELASCKTEYEYQLKTYARTKTLHEKELVSDAEYDQAYYLYEKARNAYEQAKADIVKVRRNLGYATITSPIDGVVISRAVEEGQTVAAGFETPTLFTIAADLTQMQVVADVDEADIGQVADGQRVQFTVDAYPDDTFEGTVEQVRLEATTGVERGDLRSGHHGLQPRSEAQAGADGQRHDLHAGEGRRAGRSDQGAALRARRRTARGVGLTVEQPAEQTVAGRREIWVKEGQTLAARFVVTGAASGDRTEIVEGLSDGDVVAVGLTAASAAPAAAVERSPFMPSGPGRKQKNRP